MIKKIIIVLVLLVMLAGGALAFAISSAGSLVEGGVVTYGPQQLKVPVKLEGAEIDFLAGRVGLTGFALGQPDGYGDDTMIGFKGFEINMKMMSLFGDHLVVDTLVLDTPSITARFKDGKTNFQSFADGLGAPAATEPEAASETGTATETETAPGPTVTIRRLEIRTPRMAVDAPGLIDQQDIELETIVLTDLGTDEQGLSMPEIMRHVTDALTPQLTKALVKAQASGKLDDLQEKGKKKLKKGLDSIIGKLKKKRN